MNGSGGREAEVGVADAETEREEREKDFSSPQERRKLSLIMHLLWPGPCLLACLPPGSKFLVGTEGETS